MLFVEMLLYLLSTILELINTFITDLETNLFLFVVNRT
jgi:hypothetical protein